MAASSSSFFSEFGLLLYLEELDKEQLNKFKLLLKNETVEPGHCQIPWSEVKKANRQELADLMNKYYPEEQAWSVTLKIFGKMNLKELCEKAKAEISSAAQTMRPEDNKARETQGNQKAELGVGTEYRIQVKEKFCIMRDKNYEGFCHRITQEDQELLEHLFDVDVKTGEQPQTVVLQGAGGVGKTTLMRKAMLDWAEGNLYQQKFTCVFYLNAREINQLKERSFVQLISKDWPSREGPIERIMSEPGSLLFIIDSFDELNFAFEEPEFALSSDRTQQHPVSFLMSSLLRKVMLPESSLLVTTTLTAYKRLKPLLKSHHYVELVGMSEDARKEYVYQFFEDKKWALQAFRSLRNNEMLFNMCQVPLLCRVISTCLKEQMEKAADVTLNCQTTTSLFTCYISRLVTSVDGSCPSLPDQLQLKNLCHLAAKGIWTMTYVFYRDNLRKHGLNKSDVSIFLDMNILQKDSEYDNCYVFTHLQIQEFFAAMFYLLKGKWETRDYSFQSFEDSKLLIESKAYEDIHLMQMKNFLFGLLNEDKVKHLETIFYCKMSLELKGELLQWMETLGKSESPSQLRFLELFLYLYETQDEAFINQAMGYFQMVAIDICRKMHLLVSSFCLKHCRCLKTIKLSVTVVFEKMLNSRPEDETWQIDRDHITHCWQDLCSVLHTNEYLRELELFHSNLDELAAKTLYQELRHPNCKLQKLLLRFMSFPDGCQGIFNSMPQNQNLIHLDLKGSDIGENGVKSLCEALKHPECELQNLRLERCGLRVAVCEDLSSALLSSKRLIHLSLAHNALEDSGVKLIIDALKHPQCTLQSLILMGCLLTSACCPDLASAILNNSNLRILDLGNNYLQDDGVKILCEALRHPSCNIQSLGLECCGLTSLCCQDLSSTLSISQTLIKINLTRNTLRYEGIKKLCEVLQSPGCKLQILGLSKKTFDKEAQKLLEAVGVSNPSLIIKSTRNDQNEEDGSWWQHL
ncbi:PREDICTED: NACHT, LRR and PYD domains-containing protein 14 [Chrysochloris asiatica]|uniref:NACHT, LRR and PYD domains-containing protein 14 n=1 Tax=Chrysochloris asiatica TaxID=185453 RepID=A0A9B0TTX9_CHRAS|nr:PREDICTED: NACHT, LRR and PYD domains-containing protein 14 [Chrysochloris asiatica]